MLSAVLIVMFCASLPVSLSGWGVREFSAATALGVVGVAPAVAVAGAVMVGLLSLVLTLLLAAFGALAIARRPSAGRPAEALESPAARQGDVLSGHVLRLCAILCATLVLFQIRVPLAHGEIMANLADVIALTGLGLFAIDMMIRRSLAPMSGVMLAALGTITLTILGGLVVGNLRFGANDWALVNRGLGWIIVLGYVAVGSSAGRASVPRAEGGLLLCVFAVAAAVVGALHLLALVLVAAGQPVPAGTLAVPLRGFASNANTFAVQLALAAVAVFAADRLGVFGRRKSLPALLLLVIGFALAYSRARAGVVLLVMIVVLAVALGPRPDRRRAWRLGGFALAGIAVTFGLLDNLVPIPGVASRFVHESSDSERWQTITDGLDLWRRHPWFGGGLGAYSDQRMAAGRPHQVIHSVPIWLLAEFGVAGFVATATVFLLLCRHAILAMRRPETAAFGWAALAVLLTIAVGGLVHDFFFQRTFWFLLGLSFACGLARPDRGTSVDRSA